jgi:hypothetical protein
VPSDDEDPFGELPAVPGGQLVGGLHQENNDIDDDVLEFGCSRPVGLQKECRAGTAALHEEFVAYDHKVETLPPDADFAEVGVIASTPVTAQYVQPAASAVASRTPDTITLIGLEFNLDRPLLEQFRAALLKLKNSVLDNVLEELRLPKPGVKKSKIETIMSHEVRAFACHPHRKASDRTPVTRGCAALHAAGPRCGLRRTCSTKRSCAMAHAQ